MRFSRTAPARTTRLGRALAAAMALGLVLVVAGCGSSSSGSSTSTPESTSTPASTPTTTASTATETTPAAGASSSLKLEANPEGQLKYNTTSLSAKAGAVSIAFTNSSPVGHNVTVESSSGETVGATPTFQGGSKTLSLNLKAGTYKFYCSVPGHRMAGMEGTLTVK
jgi:plastocyanin